ncbi:DNA polymerase IV [Salibacterium qingdaonense]|uniref:DNA polymerase IV n=1 Tax=Salibacterium qingdaonense TaxID=266892 RepID=A0A1I4IPF0_9BACI|nr:DNA polymerase IV [Salibacterium qingdaonense]SFL55646.1 DNA polymerase-4 [Salibacterium qingdaonense]
MKEEKIIFLIDMQSFYAAVEKTENSDLDGKPVVVSGDPDRRNGVILAACPLAKQAGVVNAERLWEAQEKCPEAVVIRPRMQRYIDVSMQITTILERFTDVVECFSIDEQFIDISRTKHLFGDPMSVARKVQAAIMEEIGLCARIGIGANKVLAKMACDHFAKKNREGIFWLKKEKVQTDMWSSPIHNMFGVGSRMEKHFRNMGIRTIGQLAACPVDILKKNFGINGQVLWMTANGIDYSPVSTESFQGQEAIGHAMTLPRDYASESDIKVVLLELCEEVGFRTRNSHLMGITISVSIVGADFNFPTGFHRQTKSPEPTNSTMDLYHIASELLLKYWNRNPIRKIGVTLSQLSPDDMWQLNLFADREKKLNIGYTMDDIKNRFGSTAVVRASSLTSAGQALERSQKIGGHYQ